MSQRRAGAGKDLHLLGGQTFLLGEQVPKLAGQLGDGMNTPAGPDLRELIGIAREARARSGGDPESFDVTVSASPSRRVSERLAELGVHRSIVYVRAPYVEGVARAHDALGR